MSRFEYSTEKPASCSRCSVVLTSAVAPPGDVRYGGYCRECKRLRQIEWRAANPSLNKAIRSRAQVKARERFGWRLQAVKDAQSLIRRSRELAAAMVRGAEKAAFVSKESRRQWNAAFFGKLFQVCVDCQKDFIPKILPTSSIRQVRCFVCGRYYRNATHNGDPERRCEKYDVTYQPFNVVVVILERDKWTCQICGCPTPKEKRGSIEWDAPEIDHIWPLAEIRNGAKSPGHIPENCRCACRRCNNEHKVSNLIA